MIGKDKTATHQVSTIPRDNKAGIMIKKDSPIHITGSGAWGLSTALHLLNSGYTNITVFDRSPTIPSPYSAACDLNKIVRPEYEDPFYTDLALKAIKGWQTPLFGPYYHHTGYVVAATGRAPRKAVEHLEKALESIETHPLLSQGIRRLATPEDFKEFTWQYSGPLSGFKGYFNRSAGYAHSSDTLHGIFQHCASRGVKFLLGETTGSVVSILYSGSGSRAIGLNTADGKTHPSDLVIVALGAAAATLIPSIGKFTTARCWSVAHIQLSESECDFLRGIPTTNIRDLGFFFEPDFKTRLFKLCPLGVGFTNTDPGTGVSLPPKGGGGGGEMKDFIPREDEEKLRRLLRETFPWMAERPFVEKKMCWFSDTADSDYVIDFVPGTEGSVVCSSGDSGHGFKMMPVFGEWVVSLLEKGKQEEKRWRWKDVDLTGKDWGEGVSWRIGEGGEWKDLVAAKEKLVKARL